MPIMMPTRFRRKSKLKIAGLALVCPVAVLPYIVRPVIVNSTKK